MPPHDPHILPTGWRITGRGAASIAERAAAYAVERLPEGDVANPLYTLQCTMHPLVRGRPAVEVVLDAITDEIRETWPECPRLVRDQEAQRTPSKFGGLRFEILADLTKKEWIGELIWRAVHPVVAGAAITTRVLLEERPAFTRLSVRVTADAGADSVRGFVGAGQAQPAFVRALRRDVDPTWRGGPLAAHNIRRGETAYFVRHVLASPERDIPVVVLSCREDGSFAVDPDDLAWELLGRAELHVMREHAQSFELTDAIGDRQMSCYWGAAHCYLPAWSPHDDPREHPLLLADRLEDPVLRATWLGEIGMWTAFDFVMPPSIEERKDAAARPPKVVEPKPSPAPETKSTPARDVVPAPPPAQPAPSLDLRPIIDALGAVRDMVRQLTEEVDRLRTISAVRSSSTSAIERRLGRIEDMLQPLLAGAEAMADTEASTDDVATETADEERKLQLAGIVQDTADRHSDALVFLDNAHASANDSPYEDPERVRAILEAMAGIARRRRDGKLRTSLREAFGDRGIEYRGAIARNTSAKLREQYRYRYLGREFEAEEHIVLGNTYDPRRCLRIYFSSRVPNEPRFVIAHVGRHFDVKTTT